MQKNLKSKPKPSLDEEFKLKRYFILPGWQFESLIEQKCILISDEIIYWNETEPHYAKIYGLRAVLKDSGKLCIANFLFIMDTMFISLAMLNKLLRLSGC